ncbi:hypothetical protein Malapachy_0253 [Malassezia pachydermatis]|uniref:Uncharacterized protein n=1 Tax=Malassezia pachydermatis TaxID=77020 RepID=A0A0M9VNG5_9BASI|nr:hypothetical protein Malapachy_0253 [Malassezia pachydermatis]KOS13339.1 hypothetical protein Malapachy_0253 [Malassezia pachydermatis]
MLLAPRTMLRLPMLASLGARSFSTSASSSISRRGKRLIKQKKDDDLRRAVTLYHLTPSFYPVPTKGAQEQDLDDAVTESILGPFMGKRRGQPFVQFATTNDLHNMQKYEQQSGQRNTLGQIDLYDSATIQGTFASKTPSPLPPVAGDNESLRRHFVKQPAMYQSRRARDTAGHGDLYSQEDMTKRSAQVRDALFGTVSGELPGLEIVREHEREWDAQEKK